jgi:hypothetical protein
VEILSLFPVLTVFLVLVCTVVWYTYKLTHTDTLRYDERYLWEKFRISRKQMNFPNRR